MISVPFNKVFRLPVYLGKNIVLNGGRNSVSSIQFFSNSSIPECKLVFVVNSSLKMGKGKIAAQCSHASVLAYKQTCNASPDVLQRWENLGPVKVVKADDEEALFELITAAQKVGLITSLVRDPGRTQVPSGSKTVLGMGPGPEELVDSVAGHLKLL